MDIYMLTRLAAIQEIFQLGVILSILFFVLRLFAWFFSDDELGTDKIMQPIYRFTGRWRFVALLVMIISFIGIIVFPTHDDVKLMTYGGALKSGIDVTVVEGQN